MDQGGGSPRGPHSPGETVTILVPLTRFVHMGSLTLLVGLFVFLVLVARPAFRRAADLDGEAAGAFERGLVRLAGGSLLVAFVSALTWLGAQAALVSGQTLRHALAPRVLGAVLTQTEFGRVWQLRLGLLVLLGALLFLHDRMQRRGDHLALHLEGLLLGGAVFAALAWAGHAAATEGPARLPHLAADVLHLLATGAWLGGLLPLALLLRTARRSRTPAWWLAAREATRRFSLVGLVSVVSLVLTGAVNSWVLVGSVAGLVGTPYGWLLLLKLACVSLAVGVAAHNRLRLMPGILGARPTAPETPIDELLRRLGRNVKMEVLLGAGILLIVGVLGITPPAEHGQPTWPFPFRLAFGVTWYRPGVRQALMIGGLGTALGILALVYGILGRRLRLWAIGIGLGTVAFYGSDSLRHAAVDAYLTTYLRSSVTYQAASIANGLHLYQTDCAICHGAGGFGDGPAGRALRPPPADLTARHTGDHTAGDLYWWLSHGIRGSAMPGFQEQLSETERWDLINFLRALSAAEQARGLGPVVEPAPWLVAPDFSFDLGVGSGETLKEQRGKAVVHLVLFTLPGSLPRLDRIDAAWETIGAAGARVIAVPMRGEAVIYRALGLHALHTPVAVDGSPEITAAYTIFRRTLNAEGVPPVPSHMEFLIDRQGYIRARWIPGEGPGWTDISRLLREIAQLNTEPPGVPAPDEHVH